MDVSAERKTVARAALNGFGNGMPTVTKYWDDSRASSVDILSVLDSPQPGVTSFATIGVFEHTIGLTVDDKPLRVEFVGACGSEYKVFENILATCAFHVINSKRSVRPGTIFRNVVSIYLPNAAMQHVLFTSPFLWDNGPHALNLASTTVAWLLVIPISDSERKLAETSGVDALEALLEERRIDVFNLNRTSEV